MQNCKLQGNGNVNFQAIFTLSTIKYRMPKHTHTSSFTLVKQVILITSLFNNLIFTILQGNEQDFIPL